MAEIGNRLDSRVLYRDIEYGVQPYATAPPRYFMQMRHILKPKMARPHINGKHKYFKNE